MRREVIAMSGSNVSGELRFAFGKNWANFLQTVDDVSIAEAKASIQKAVDAPSLQGLLFLDAGCGSGLFSLVARQLGACVRSFDYDAASVDCARALKDRYFPDDPDWTIEQGSVLDEDYIRALGQFDVVYSWGVLHHTGNMWQALQNVSTKVHPGGRLALAIYNDQGTASRRWR